MGFAGGLRFLSSDSHEDRIDERIAETLLRSCRGETASQVGMTGIENRQQCSQARQRLVLQGNQPVVRSVIGTQVPPRDSLKERLVRRAGSAGHIERLGATTGTAAL